MGESIEIQLGKILWDPTVIYHVPPPKAREMSVKIVQAQTSNVTAGVNVLDVIASLTLTTVSRSLTDTWLWIRVSGPLSSWTIQIW